MLRLLHLSDIHFRGYEYPWDNDADQRKELIRDVERLVCEGGPLDGILVGGDVAFGGKKEEYDDAAEWLAGLIEAAQCDGGAVWMVPGNHDVDVGIAEKSAIVQGFFTILRSCDIKQVSKELHARLYGDPASAALFSHLAGYNAFAYDRQCLTSAQHPHWFDLLDLGGRPVLLWGLNSALVSDKSDCGGEKGPPTLVLGEQQCQIPRDDQQIRIVLCHHPPSWIRDWDEVEPYLHRAHVLLFGHEHTVAVRQECDGAPVHVHAGAVGPERQGVWSPTYNLLSLAVENDRLNVVVQPRVWDPDQTCFGPSEDAEHVRFVDLPEPRRTPADEVEAELAGTVDEVRVEPAPATPVVSESPSAAGAASPSETIPVRHIVYRYLNLAPSRRIAVAQALGVLEDSDFEHDDPFGKVLQRIGERGLLNDLKEELDR